MKPLNLLFLPALCAFVGQPLGAPGEDPTLTVSLHPDAVQLHVQTTGVDHAVIAAVIGALTPELQHYTTLLPPLLADHVVLDVGIIEGADGFVTRLPESAFPAGHPVFVQGVTFDQGNLLASEVQQFVLDVTVPQGGF